MKLAPLGRARSQRGMDAKTCHPDASVDHAFSPCCFLVPGATEDIASHLRRTIADAAMHLHVPRGAASTGNIKVAFCQSFSVRRHKARASRSLRTCWLPHVCAAAGAPACECTRPSSQACRYLETSSDAGSLGRPKSVEKSRLGEQNRSKSAPPAGPLRPRRPRVANPLFLLWYTNLPHIFGIRPKAEFPQKTELL